MIHPDWTFHYVARLKASDTFEREISVMAAPREGWRGQSLAGRAPRLRFCDGLLILIATTTEDAQVKWFSFQMGDVVSRAAQPGDIVEAVRDGDGCLAVVVRRNGAIIAAAGALTSPLVGPDAEITPGTPHASIRVGADGRELRERESAVIGGYDVYVERPAPGGLDGPSACFSFALATDAVVVNAARRSAVLLALQPLDALRGEHVDGRYIKIGGHVGSPPTST